MAFILFIFVVAAAISCVAAYFSLVGLGSIFAASFWGVVVMGAALEVGKIVTTKWVHSNWKNPSAPWYFRSLLCFFIVCLMAITSLGIYGYLSKGHLEQQAPLAGLSIQVAQLEQQVDQKQKETTQLQSRLDQISRITDKSLETSGRAGLRAANQQKKEAADIQKKIDANNQVINNLTAKLVPLKVKTGDVEGELGVAKFIAEAMGWDGEKAIRIIIALIMAAFDPLALAMFIMGSISLREWREKQQKADGPIVTAERIGPANWTDNLKPEWTGIVREVSEKLDTQQDQFDADLITRMEQARSDRFISKDGELQIIRGPGGPLIFPSSSETSDKNLQNPVEQDYERDDREEALEQAKAAIQREREEFEQAMTNARATLDEAQDIANLKEAVEKDKEALNNAHTQLLDMEARINDERELLQQWEDQLTQQQNAINAWRPSDNDPRTAKEKIIEMLEHNPDIINDIVQVVEAMRLSRPGL